MSDSSLKPGLFTQERRNSLANALGACRSQFFAVGAYSGVINLLQLTVSIYMMQVFDRVLATRNLDTLTFLSVAALFGLLIFALLEGVRALMMHRVGIWVEAQLTGESFSRALESQLLGRPYRMEALRDLQACRQYLSSGGVLVLYDIPWVPVYLAVIFLLHPAIGMIALVGAILLFGLTVTSELVTSSLLKRANIASIMNQKRADGMVRNAEVIDSMGMGQAVLARWLEGSQHSLPNQVLAADRATILLSITKFTRLALQIAVLGVGAWLVLQQQLTAGSSIAASIIMSRALAPVEQLIGAWQGLVQARLSYRRLQAFLTQPRLRPPGLPLPPPMGRLTVDRVTFGFASQGVALIKGVSFNANPGESLAIIGPSAAGKTTLIRLLIGTLPPSSGSVRLDGADVFNWQREDFGRYVGYLPQSVDLFDGTIFSNIARMAAAQPDDVYAAAKLAGCHEMILALPQGYETEIGDGGQHLSGGQRQMVGLARAMFGNPRLLVLDEPNSNLDGEGEERLIRGLREMKARGATIIVVSHRPALVQDVDKVLFLRAGMIEAFGPKAEVLKRVLGASRPTEIANTGPAARAG
jgi:ATP-binding cassette subfamily C protein/ATP-binding cassette subfamily C protein EexD